MSLERPRSHSASRQSSYSLSPREQQRKDESSSQQSPQTPKDKPSKRSRKHRKDGHKRSNSSNAMAVHCQLDTDSLRRQLSECKAKLYKVENSRLDTLLFKQKCDELQAKYEEKVRTLVCPHCEEKDDIMARMTSGLSQKEIELTEMKQALQQEEAKVTAMTKKRDDFKELYQNQLLVMADQEEMLEKWGTENTNLKQTLEKSVVSSSESEQNLNDMTRRFEEKCAQVESLTQDSNKMQQTCNTLRVKCESHEDKLQYSLEEHADLLKKNQRASTENESLRSKYDDLKEQHVSLIGHVMQNHDEYERLQNRKDGELQRDISRLESGKKQLEIKCQQSKLDLLKERTELTRVKSDLSHKVTTQEIVITDLKMKASELRYEMIKLRKHTENLDPSGYERSIKELECELEESDKRTKYWAAQYNNEQRQCVKTTSRLTTECELLQERFDAFKERKFAEAGAENCENADANAWYAVKLKKKDEEVRYLKKQVRLYERKMIEQVLCK